MRSVAPIDTALALRQNMQPLLDGLKLALVQPVSFDPTSSTRVFRNHLSDIGQLVFLSKIIAFLNRKTPSVLLSVRNLR
jgi:hypothetical protein